MHLIFSLGVAGTHWNSTVPINLGHEIRLCLCSDEKLTLFFILFSFKPEKSRIADTTLRMIMVFCYFSGWKDSATCKWDVNLLMDNILHLTYNYLTLWHQDSSFFSNDRKARGTKQSPKIAFYCWCPLKKKSIYIIVRKTHTHRYIFTLN